MECIPYIPDLESHLSRRWHREEEEESGGGGQKRDLADQAMPSPHMISVLEARLRDVAYAVACLAEPASDAA